MIRLDITLQIPDGTLPPPHVSPSVLRMLATSAANSTALLVKKNFTRLSQKSNSRKFWAGAERGTTAKAGEGITATVFVDWLGVRLHWKGGTVKPTGKTSAVTGRPTRALLIPFSDSPMRKRDVPLAELGIPSQNIRVLKSRKGAPCLVSIDPKKTRTNIIWLGKLVKQTTHTAKPDTIPKDKELANAAAQGAIARAIELITP